MKPLVPQSGTPVANVKLTAAEQLAQNFTAQPGFQAPMKKAQIVSKRKGLLLEEEELLDEAAAQAQSDVVLAQAAEVTNYASDAVMLAQAEVPAAASGASGSVVGGAVAGGTTAGVAGLAGMSGFALAGIALGAVAVVSEFESKDTPAPGPDVDAGNDPQPDTTPPAEPTATVANDGASVTGTAEADSTVTVRAADGTTVLGSATTDGNGAYTVTLNPVLTNGEQVSVIATDAANNVSQAITVNAPDTTFATIENIALSATQNAAGGFEQVTDTGDTITVSVQFSESVNVAGGTPTITLDIGGEQRQATYALGTGTNTLTFTYAVVDADLDHNGVTVVADSLALNGATIGNAQSGAANLDFAAVTPTTAVHVDAIATGDSLLIRGTEADGSWYFVRDLNADGVHDGNDVGSYATMNALSGQTFGGIPVAMASFGQPVAGTGQKPGTAVADGQTANPTYDGLYAVWDANNGDATTTGLNGAPDGWATDGLTGVDVLYWTSTSPSTSSTNRFAVNLETGFVNDSTPGVNRFAAYRVGAADTATVQNITVSGTVDGVGGFNKVVDTGDVISVSVSFDNAVAVNTTGGTPTIEIGVGGVMRTATYNALSSGTNNLVFTYDVVEEDFDHDGVTVNANSLALNGATISDAFFSNVVADLSFDAVTPTTPLRVDAFATGSGTNLMIRGTEADGNWYFVRDRNGDGAHGSGDTGLYGAQNTLDGVTTASGITLSLMTLGVTTPAQGSIPGTAVADGQTTNPTYDGLAALWDANNGAETTTGLSGVPDGWDATGVYLSSTTSPSGVWAMTLNNGGVLDRSTSSFIAYQVI